MDPALLALIHEYQQRAVEAVRLLKEHLQVENPYEWGQAGVPQMGILGVTSSQYAFHGTGVTLASPSWYCGFDFGYEGRYDGFRADKLASLARKLGGQFSSWDHWQAIGNELTEQTKRGLLHQPFLSFYDDLYYFRNR